METSLERRQAMQALAEAIAELFTRKELELLLRQTPAMLALLRELPGPEASAATVGDAVVCLLERRGELDVAFLTLVRTSRPMKEAEIRTIAAGLGIDPLRLCPAAIRASSVDVRAFLQTLAISGWAIWNTADIEHMGVVLGPAMLAPLLLLRSEASTSDAARMYLAYRQLIERWIGIPVVRPDPHTLYVRFALSAVRSFALMVMLVGGSLVVRVIGVLKHPLAGARAILPNWTYLTFSQRIVIEPEPELVPNTGIVTLAGDTSGRSARIIGGGLIAIVVISLIGEPSYAMFIGFKWLLYLLLAAGFIYFWDLIMLGISLVYRVSLKASFALWFPVALAIHVGMNPKLPPDVYLEFMQTSEIHKIKRVLAACIVVMFVVCRVDTDLLGSFSGLLDGTSGVLLCLAATLVLVVHYAIVEPSREHLRLGIRSWSTIVRWLEITRMVTVVAVVAAVFVRVAHLWLWSA
jgi:hypothetical protein